jgi:hypothetical protein
MQRRGHRRIIHWREIHLHGRGRRRGPGGEGTTCRNSLLAKRGGGAGLETGRTRARTPGQTQSEVDVGSTGLGSTSTGSLGAAASLGRVSIALKQAPTASSGCTSTMLADGGTGLVRAAPPGGRAPGTLPGTRGASSRRLPLKAAGLSD